MSVQVLPFSLRNITTAVSNVGWRDGGLITHKGDLAVVVAIGSMSLTPFVAFFLRSPCVLVLDTEQLFLRISFSGEQTWQSEGVRGHFSSYR